MQDKTFRNILKILCLILFLLVVSYCIFNLINLQIYHNKEKQQNINLAKPIKVKEEPSRGNILTNNGQYLVKEELYYTIVLEPSLLSDKYIKPVLELISKYNNLDVDTLYKQFLNIKKNNRKSFVAGENISYSDKLLLDKDIKKFISSHKDLKTIKFYYPQAQSERKYIEYDTYQNIVGYISLASNYGLESYYNKDLSGIAGEYETIRPNSDFQTPYSLQLENYKKVLFDKQDGYNLQLSLDTIIQNYLVEVIKNTHEKTKAQSVMGIVMDIDDGSIVAMAQSPNAKSKASIKNLNITNLFEPGSIFKPIITSIAINEGLIDENTLIESEGFIKVKDRIIRDHDDTTKGVLPLKDIIAHSGNVAMVKISNMINNKILFDYLENFGFSSKTGIDIDFEYSNKMPTLKELTEVRKANVSFGQGIATTQIGMITALVATINGGKLIIPHFVKAITSEDGKIVKKNELTVKKQILTEQTSQKIRQMLSNVVTSGTGKKVQIKGYTIGGKTGTAQKATDKGYEKGKYYSSFFAFFPIDKPKYGILITVDEPQGINYYGASVALPAAREVIEKIINYNDIRPDKQFELVSDKENQIKSLQNEYTKTLITDRIITDKIIKEQKDKIEGGIMPNLINFSKKDVINIFPADYNIQFNGYGRVKSQNIKENDRINKDTKIILELE